MSATQPISNPLPPRKSFAQVAAAANAPAKPKDKTAIPQSPTPNGQLPTQVAPAPLATNGLNKTPQQPSVPVAAAPTSKPVSAPQASQVADVDQLGRLMDKAAISNEVAPHPSVEELSKTAPPSDTKSVTSRTTLALDEKESLRPDDSASMQAAVEDESISLSGSAVTNSKQSSDPDARAFRDQLHEIDITGAQNLAAQREDTARKSPTPGPQSDAVLYPSNTPQTTYAPPQPPPASSTPDVPLNALNVPPDDKLLEALASPKDRLFVLKVEQDMIDFIKDSKEECLQLPATNSFYRLLSHKLADYYLLGHVVDESMMSVRIFRTPNCRLPPPLIGNDPPVDGSEPTSAAPARKIMRRNPTDNRSNEQGAGSDPNFDSLTSSKAPSDSGAGGAADDSRDATADKSTLTREERENRYNEARARIFKDFESVEVADNSNASVEKGISRTSSASGVRKAKKKNKPKDDGFEARSAFDQYGQRIVPPETMDHSPFDGNVYGAPAQFSTVPFHPGIANFQPVQSYNYANGYNQMPSPYWNGQSMPHGYPSPHHEAPSYPSYGPLNGYDGNQYSSMNMASQSTPKGNHPTLAHYPQNYMPPNESFGWNQSVFTNAYAGGGYAYADTNAQYPTQFQGGHMMQSPPMAPNGPYPGYGVQEPHYLGQGQPFSNYNNPHFNPRSQNFIPTARSGGFGQFSPDPNMGYPKNGQGPFFGSPPMQRQNSNTSHGSNFSGNPPGHPQANNAGMRHSGRGQTQSPLRYPQGQPRGQPQQQQQQQQHNSYNTSSSITKWSTPANLPAKPPPPAIVSPFVEVPRDPDNQQPLPPKPFTGFTNNSGGSPNGTNQTRYR